MNAKNTRSHHHAPMLTLGDIYFILFRHKWKILSISAAALLIGLILPLVWPREYESETKILIKYVLDNRLPTGGNGNGGSASLTLPDATGRNVINTELQILTSLDLALEVATNIGPDRIVGKTNANMVLAASIIHNGLTVEVPLSSDVIRLTFKHKDPTVVQEVLKQIIVTYQERHAEIHRPEGVDEMMDQEAGQLRDQLRHTEEALRIAQTNLGVISVADAKKVLSDKLNKIQEDLDDSKVSLATHKATIDALSKRISVSDLPTNNTAVAPVDTNSIPPEIVAEYKKTCDMLEVLRDRDKKLLLDFLPGNSRVKDVEAQIARHESHKKEMETNTPALLVVKVATTSEAKSEENKPSV